MRALLRLRVFAYTDATRLRRLLSSLAATDWEGDQARISLEISIDHPRPSPDEDEVRGWNAVNAEANAFQWNQGLRSPSGIGEKSVIEQPYHIGRVGQWLRGWVPPQGRDDELMLYLSDSVVLSPSSWYRFLEACPN